MQTANTEKSYGEFLYIYTLDFLGNPGKGAKVLENHLNPIILVFMG